VIFEPVIALQSQGAFWKWSMAQLCRNRERIISVVIAATFLLSCASAPQTTKPQFSPVPGLEQRQVQFQQVIYPFSVFVPSSLNGTHSAPALLLIHGGGGNGPGMIALWENFAETNGIILVGPTLPLGGDFETAVAPQLYPIIMDAARREWNIDGKRMYLFGISAGGYTVFDVSMFDSQYFTAGGVFAAVITSDYDWIVQKATRKIPIAIYMGDHDQYFTVAQAQSTRDLLADNGFPVSLTIFPNLDHNYNAMANAVNADVWTFFSQAPPP